MDWGWRPYYKRALNLAIAKSQVFWLARSFIPSYILWGKLLRAIFDPGADCTSITIGCLERLGLTDRIDPSFTIAFTTADDSESLSLGLLHNVHLTIPPLSCTITHMFVTKCMSYDILVGLDVIKYFIMTMDIMNERYILHDRNMN